MHSVLRLYEIGLMPAGVQSVPPTPGEQQATEQQLAGLPWPIDKESGAEITPYTDDMILLCLHPASTQAKCSSST